MWPEVPFIQEVSGLYTFLLLDIDEQQMALLGSREQAPDYKTTLQ